MTPGFFLHLMRKIFLLSVILTLSSFITFSQDLSVTGRVADLNNESLIGSTVVLLKKDSSLYKGDAVDVNGSFSIQGVKSGNYILKVSFLGYDSYYQDIKLNTMSLQIGTIKLKSQTQNLSNVEIKGKLPAASLKGDTIEFNSAAYKVNPDATVENLITKMPGVMVQDGKIQSQGEDVKKVLINGKEFFGGDPSIALKNLPADVVDKVQVFDQQSEQARFTGFNDGNTEKTINIITKENMNNGVFGKVYGGYGLNDRYSIGGNINIFNGAQKISILGMSNNINQQNFSAQDLLGITSSSGSSQRGPFGGPMPGGPPSGGGSGGSSSGGMFGPNSSANNFTTSSNGGINTNTSLGLNYMDDWGKKVKFTGSYFFNNSKNTTSSNTYRTYFLSDSLSQIYKENSTANSNNINHRANMKLEYAIDSANSITYTPSFSYQKNTSSTLVNANSLRGTSALNSSDNAYTTNLAGYNFSNTFLYRHKFAKPGRTFSIDLTGSYSHKDGNGILQSDADYYENDSSYTIDQNTYSKTSGYTVSSTITYTEPLSKSWQMMVNVSPSYSHTLSDKSTNALDSLSNTYARLDSSLSNAYTYNTWKNKGGLSFRFAKGKMNLNFGADYQFTSLLGKQTFPNTENTQLIFHNVLPRLDMIYKFSKSINLHIGYMSSTQTPSITQIQDVLDNSNPLSVSRGNPLLKQQYQHNIISGLRILDKSLTRIFFLSVGGNLSDSYISSSTFTASTDTTLADGTSLSSGSQYTKPVNLSGYRNFRSFAVYSFPINPIKTKLNVNVGYNYTKLPGLVNEQLNYSNTSKVNAGLVLASNISTQYDFTLSYMANYSFVKNSIQSSSDQNYYNGVASARVNIMPFSFLNISSDLNYTHYVGLNDVSNPSILLWNAGLGYKFLKEKKAELKLSVYDILNKNNSITRNVTTTYVEDVETQVLKRYFMLTFTYTFKSFKAGKS